MLSRNLTLIELLPSNYFCSVCYQFAFCPRNTFAQPRITGRELGISMFGGIAIDHEMLI